MKILILTPEYPPVGGGAANACQYLLRELAGLGIEVDLVTAGLSNRQEVEEHPAGRVFRLPVGKRHIHYWTYQEAVRYLWAARQFVNTSPTLNEYSLIHAFFTIPSGLLAYWKRAQLPYIISIRGSDVPGYNKRFTLPHHLLRPVTKAVWKNARSVISNSVGLRELANRTMPDLHIPVIPNGIDANEFEPAGVSSAGRPGGGVTILAVNRLIHRKGLDVLIDAFRGLRADGGPPVRLVIVGDGNLRQSLEAYVERERMSATVEFMGAVPHAEIAQYYRQADIFVMPSRAEGMSNAILEAMASGLPIVCTDTGGTLELVKDNGLVVPVDDPFALRSALSRLVAGRELRASMGMRSRRRATELTWAKTAAAYAELYEEIALRPVL